MSDICPECSVQDCNECLPAAEVNTKKVTISGEDFTPFTVDVPADGKDFNIKIYGRKEPTEILTLTKSQVDEVIQKKDLKKIKSSEDGTVVKQCDLHIEKGKKQTSDDYRATEEELSLINSIALEKRSTENTYVFTFQAADDLVDRGYEHFTRSALREMASLAVKNKIPFLTNGDYDHQWRQKNVYGIVFDAKESGGKLLYKVFIPDIARNKDVLDAILSGLYSKLSVGFSLNLEDFVCDTCKKSIFYSDCEHYPGMMDEKGNICTATIKAVKDNFEISGCAVPMQSESHITSKSVPTADSFTLSYRKTFDELKQSLAPRILGFTKNGSTFTLKNSAVDTINNDNTPQENEMSDLKNVVDEQEVESQEDSNPSASAEDAQEDSKPEPQDNKSVPSVETKEINVKVSLDESQLVELVKTLVEKVDALTQKLESNLETVKTQLSLATEASSDALTKKLKEAQKPEPRHWVLDNFSIDLAKQLGEESEND